jgi:hypothetical protein
MSLVSTSAISVAPNFDTVGGIVYLLMQLPRKILHLQLQVGLPHLHL